MLNFEREIIVYTKDKMIIILRTGKSKSAADASCAEATQNASQTCL